MSRDIDITVLIAVRGGSKRVPRKNIRPFAASNLLTLKVQQALRLKDVNAVVVTSEDPEMLKIAEDLGAIGMPRPPLLRIRYCSYGGRICSSGIITEV